MRICQPWGDTAYAEVTHGPKDELVIAPAPRLLVETYISYVISVYDAGISAHKFTTLVPNLVWVLGFSLSTTLVAQWVIMHIASLKVI